MYRGNTNNIHITPFVISERQFPESVPPIRVQRLGAVSSNAAICSLLEETYGYDAYDSPLHYNPSQDSMTVLRYFKKPAA